MIYVYILYFFILSFIGYVYETLAMTVWGGKWENRGFFYGPVIPIYGAGALMGTLLFSYLMPDHTPLQVFLIGMIASAVLEFSVHYVLEKLFNRIWWDYSKSIWNIQGRICLPASIGSGIGALIFIYVINPYLLPRLIEMPLRMRMTLCTVLMLVFVLDLVLTVQKLHGRQHIVEQKYQQFNSYMERTTGKFLDESMALSKPVYRIFDRIDHGNRVQE